MDQENKIVINLEYRVDAHFNWVNPQLVWIKRIPEDMQRYISQRGAAVVFFAHKLTDLPEMSNKKAKKNSKDSIGRRRLWGNIKAAYNRDSKKMFIGKNAGYAAVLHELGHCVDHLFENLSNTSVLQRSAKEKSELLREWYIWDLSKRYAFDDIEEVQKERKIQKGFFSYPDEFFAECFRMFYRDKTSKSLLEKISPCMYETLKYIDQVFAKDI